MGGGGKTTLIFSLAKTFASYGKRVCITTTTKMYRVADTSEYTQLGTVLEQDSHKITALPEEAYKALRDSFDVILVEADGSRRLPMKVPAAHEPVLPSDTDLVIGILGASSIGKPIEEVCFRAELACDILGYKAGHIVTRDDLLYLLDSPLGQKKGVVTDYRMVIGQGDLLAEPPPPKDYYVFTTKERYEDIIDSTSGGK